MNIKKRLEDILKTSSHCYQHPDTVETTNVKSSSVMRPCPNDAQSTQQNESSIANDVHWVTPKPHPCNWTCMLSSAFYFCACRLSGRQEQWKKALSELRKAKHRPNVTQPNSHSLAIAQGNVSHNVHIYFKMETSFAMLYNYRFPKFKTCSYLSSFFYLINHFVAQFKFN